MKKIIATFLIITVGNALFGQDKKHDLSISYGVLTTDQVIDVIEDVLVTVFTFGEYTKDNYHFTGARFITYKNGVTRHLKAGFTLGVDGVKGDLLSNDIVYGRFNERHVTFAGETDLRYINTRWFQMYSGLGLGYTFTRELGEDYDSGTTDVLRSGHFNLQVNALGIRVGNSFAAYLETGFGYKGVLNFGLSYRFE